MRLKDSIQMKYRGLNIASKQMLYSLKRDGISVTLKKSWSILTGKIKKNSIDVREWMDSPLFTESQLLDQRESQFPQNLQFYIVCRNKSDSESLNDETIKSLQKQTCSRWVLLTDDNCCNDDYLVLLNDGDVLHPAALYEVAKAINETNADFIYTDEMTFSGSDIHNVVSIDFKSDYASDSLDSVNYIGSFVVFKRELLESTNLLDQDVHALIIALTTKAKRIAHIPEVLYYSRLENKGISSSLVKTIEPVIESASPKVSIVIPNYDHVNDLKTCVMSIIYKSTYNNYEIVVVENNSKEPETFEYYNALKASYENVKVVYWEGSGFNWSALNNYGIQESNGEYIILLNNDTKVISPDWIEQMLTYAQRSDVGAVGAMLYYPNDTVQHAGIIIGLGGVAEAAFNGLKRGSAGYMERLKYPQNLSAVTGACLMVRRSIWKDVGGLNEEYKVSYNDIDFCLRIREAGYLIVWTPYAELYHYEFKSRGVNDSSEKYELAMKETEMFKERWKEILSEGDPYYNPNLSLELPGFVPVKSQVVRRARILP